jgi:hypothetical protein
MQAMIELVGAELPTTGKGDLADRGSGQFAHTRHNRASAASAH